MFKILPRTRWRLLAILSAAAALTVVLFWIAQPAGQVSSVAAAPQIQAAISKEYIGRKGTLPVSRSREAEETAESVFVVPDIVELARRLNHPQSNELEDISILQELLAFYRRANSGNNPEGGLNYQIALELRGQNKHQLAVLPPDLPAINQQGELVDRWGTPYFFHPVTSELMEIRSAGPDRTLWTRDDIQP